MSQQKPDSPDMKKGEVSIDLAVAGDPVARERLAVTILPRVRRIVYLCLGKKSEVEDVVQIAMVTIFRDLGSLRDPARFYGWMDKVTYNVVRTEGRRTHRRLAFFSSHDPEDIKKPNLLTPERVHLSDELLKRINDHLLKIKIKKRTAAVMSLFFGYVDHEVATMMECSIDTAKKRIQHGKKELFEKIHKDPACRALLEEMGR